MLYPLLLIVISLFIHHIWIFPVSILTYGDWWFHDPVMLKEYVKFPVIWSDYPYTMGINVLMSFYPVKLLDGALAYLGFSWAWIERIVFMWPIILGVLPMYYFLKRFFKSEVACFTGTLFYAFNSYFLMKRTDHLDFTIVMLYAPLALLMYGRVLEKRKLYLLIGTSFLFFVLSAFEFRIFYIFSVMAIIYALIFYRKPFAEYIFFVLSPFILLIIFNLFWLLPLAFTGTLSHNPLFDRAVFGDIYANILYAVAAVNPFWTSGKPAVYVMQTIQFPAFLLSMFAWIGFYGGRTKRIVLYFGLIACIGIFLTKQSGDPFPFFYSWLYSHIPGLNAFREASKFNFLTVFAYAGLLAFCIDYLQNRWRYEKRIRRLIPYCIGMIIAVYALYLSLPLIKGTAGTLFIPRTIPPDYVKLNSYIAGDNTYSRIMFIPKHSRWTTITSSHPVLSMASTIEDHWRTDVNYTLLDTSISAEKLIEIGGMKEFHNLLDQWSFKYFIVPLKDTENDDDFFKDYRVDPNYFIQVLDANSHLKRIDVGTKDIAVYENPDAKPRLYLTKKMERIAETIPFTPVQHERIDSMNYTITLPESDQTQYFYFTDFYDSRRSLTDKQTGRSQNPKKSPAGLQYYEIRPNSTHQTYTLSFTPQKYLKVGIFVSVISFISAGMGFIVWHRKKI